MLSRLVGTRCALSGGLPQLLKGGSVSLASGSKFSPLLSAAAICKASSDAKASSRAFTEVVLPKVDKLPSSHVKMFTLERYWAAAMFPVFPAALFIHNPVMDYLLAVLIAVHTHWGLETVIVDYARPFVVGKAFSTFCHYAVYVLSIGMFAALMHFNYNDVGITKAFEMIWAI
jgi:succinate dehydrogenase (ubiquinone) membrane anchor subunit